MLNTQYTYQSVSNQSIAQVSDSIPAALKNIKAKIIPFQTADGYGYPWNGGEHINQFNNIDAVKAYIDSDGSIVTDNSSRLCDYIEITDSVITVGNFDILASSLYYDFHIGFYDSGKHWMETIYETTARSYRYKTISVPSGAAYFRVSTGIIYYTFYIFAACGTYTEFTPYANICPLYPREDGCDLYLSRKTVFNDSKAQQGITNNYIVFGNQDEQEYTTAFLKEGTYTVTVNGVNAQVYAKRRSGSSYDPSYNHILVKDLNEDSATFAIVKEGDYEFELYNDDEDIMVDDFVSMQIEFGAVSTSYAPCDQTIIHVDFPAGAGTIYGGEIDFDNRKLKVSYDVIASYNGEVLPGMWYSDRDVYAPGTTPTIGAQVVYDTGVITEYTIPEVNTISAQDGTTYFFSTTGEVSFDYPDGYTVVDPDYNNAILNGNATHVRLVFPVQNVTLTDDDISINGGVVLTDILNPETDIQVGQAVSKELRVTLLNSDVFTGLDWTEEFMLDFGVDINGNTNWTTIGYFSGNKPELYYGTKEIKFVAYDRMRLFDTLADEFVSTLSFPLTVRQIYENLCSYIGVTFENGNEINNTMLLSFNNNPFTKGTSCRAILAFIAEANGCYARITPTGNVKLIWFSDQTGNYSVDADDYYNIKINEVSSPIVDSIKVSSTYDSSAVVFYYPNDTGTEVYQIIDNPFITRLHDEDKRVIVNEILTRLTAFGSYRPVTLEVVGNWVVETGDVITVEYGNGSTLGMPVFSRRLKWNGACIDNYGCTANTKRSEIIESKKEQYELGGKVAEKYTVKSGIDILDDGIIISGDKFLRLISGGVLDIDSTNFILNSDDELMKCTNWYMNRYGFTYNAMYPWIIDNETEDVGFGFKIGQVMSQGVVINTQPVPGESTLDEDQCMVYNRIDTMIPALDRFETPGNGALIFRTRECYGVESKIKFTHVVSGSTIFGAFFPYPDYEGDGTAYDPNVYNCVLGTNSYPWERLYANYLYIKKESHKSWSGSGITVHAYKVGRQVTLNFSNTLTANLAANATIVTIDATYRPITGINFVAIYGGNTSTMRMTIGTDGILKATSAISKDNGLRGTITYISAS